MARLRWIVLLAAALLASCRAFEFESQQVLLRYSAESDALDVLLVYRGVGANTHDHVENHAEQIARVVQGRRHFIVLDWMFDIDLEGVLEKELDPEDGLAQRFRLFSAGIEVLGTSLVQDPQHRLCLLQRVRIDAASTGLRMTDEFVNRWVLEEEQRTPGRWAKTFADDPRVAELWLVHARANAPWARFDDVDLVVSFPTTPKQAASTLGDVLENPEDWKPIVAALSSLRIDGEEALFRFSPGSDGWIRFDFAFPDRDSWPVEQELAKSLVLAKPGLDDEIHRLLALD